MSPLVPVVFGLAALSLEENDSYGAAAKPRTSSPATATRATPVAPTRFTTGTHLSNVSRAGGKVRKRVIGRALRRSRRRSGTPYDEAAPEAQEGEYTEEDELLGEDDDLSPEEQLDQQIESELILDDIVDQVLEDMEVGQWDENLEESLPTDEEFLAEYQPLGSSYAGVGVRRKFDFGPVPRPPNDAAVSGNAKQWLISRLNQIPEASNLPRPAKNNAVLTESAKRWLTTQIKQLPTPPVMFGGLQIVNKVTGEVLDQRASPHIMSEGAKRWLLQLIEKMPTAARVSGYGFMVPSYAKEVEEKKIKPRISREAKRVLMETIEALPTFGSSYYSARAVSPQRIDRIADAAFGAGEQADIFDPMSGWGIRRRRT